MSKEKFSLAREFSNCKRSQDRSLFENFEVYELYNLFYYEDYCVRQIRLLFEEYKKDKNIEHLEDIDYYLNELKSLHSRIETSVFELDDVVTSFKR